MREHTERHTVGSEHIVAIVPRLPPACEVPQFVFVCRLS